MNSVSVSICTVNAYTYSEFFHRNCENSCTGSIANATLLALRTLRRHELTVNICVPLALETFSVSARALKSPVLALRILYLITNMTVAVNNPVLTENSAEVAVKLHRTGT
jgi:hypothetical protein